MCEIIENPVKKCLSENYLIFNNALDKIIGPIVVGILIGIGFICLIIPGIILTLMWVFTPCIQGDRAELTFIQAMKEAKGLAKGNYIKIFFLLVILAIFAFSGSLLLNIEGMVTLPVAHVVFIVLTINARIDNF